MTKTLFEQVCKSIKIQDNEGVAKRPFTNTEL